MRNIARKRYRGEAQRRLSSVGRDPAWRTSKFSRGALASGIAGDAVGLMLTTSAPNQISAHHAPPSDVSGGQQQERPG